MINFKSQKAKIFLYLIIILVLLNSPLLFSIEPTASIDSLKSEYYKSVSDTNRISLCCEITYVSLFKQPDTTKIYSAIALELAEKTRLDYYSAIAYRAAGLSKWSEVDLRRATEYMVKALDFAMKTQNKYLVASIKGNLGLIEERIGDFPAAVKYSGEVYSYAITARDTGLMIRSCNNLGNAFNLLNENDSARKYYMKTLELSRKQRDSMGMGFAFNNLSRGLIDFEKNYDLGIKYADTAISIYKRFSYQNGLTKLYIIQAAARYNQSDYKKALNYIDSAYSTSYASKDFTMISRIMDLESTIYYDLKNYKKAYEILKKYIDVHDSVQGFTHRNKVDSMLYYYREQYKDKQIKLLQLKGSQSKTISFFLGALLILLLITAYLIYARYKSGKKMLLTLAANSEIIENQKKELESALSGLKNQNHTIVSQNSILEELNAELKSTNALKDRFLAIIAHDLRNPIGAMRNLADILHDNFNELSESELKDLIAGLKGSSHSVYELLENLLTWSRIHRGRVEFHPEPVLFRFLVDNTIAPLQLQAKGKNITIENKVPADIYVFADANMLATIIRNIASNALKFSPENTIIKISVRKYLSHATVSISDNGVGIKPESLHKLFDREGYSTAGTSNERGTGLGLVLCKEFIEIHGGKIWVQSIVGKGSTFYFTLPYKPDDSIES